MITSAPSGVCHPDSRPRGPLGGGQSPAGGRSARDFLPYSMPRQVASTTPPPGRPPVRISAGVIHPGLETTRLPSDPWSLGRFAAANPDHRRPPSMATLVWPSSTSSPSGEGRGESPHRSHSPGAAPGTCPWLGCVPRTSGCPDRGRPRHGQVAGCVSVHPDIARREHLVLTGARVPAVRGGRAVLVPQAGDRTYLICMSVRRRTAGPMRWRCRQRGGEASFGPVIRAASGEDQAVAISAR
jgi:hypothetical protein